MTLHTNAKWSTNISSWQGAKTVLSSGCLSPLHTHRLRDTYDQRGSAKSTPSCTVYSRSVLWWFVVVAVPIFCHSSEHSLVQFFWFFVCARIGINKKTRKSGQILECEKRALHVHPQTKGRWWLSSNSMDARKVQLFENKCYELKLNFILFSKYDGWLIDLFFFFFEQICFIWLDESA